MLKVVEAPDGLDFQFNTKAQAQKFSEFVRSVLPSRGRQSKQLVSHDPKSNTAFHKYTLSLEICPISKDDLVSASKMSLSREMGDEMVGGGIFTLSVNYRGLSVTTGRSKDD